MKMARASEADLEMAMELCGALDALTGWCPSFPTAGNGSADERDSEPFDRDDPEHCVRALGYVLDLADRASLMRVVWGCAVMLDPRNRCVDPNSDTIELHPAAKAGFASKQPRPLSEWSEAEGRVLWWRLPTTEAPWLGRPVDVDWPSQHTHWTPVTVPDESSMAPATALSSAQALYS